MELTELSLNMYIYFFNGVPTSGRQQYNLKYEMPMLMYIGEKKYTKCKNLILYLPQKKKKFFKIFIFSPQIESIKNS